MNIFDFGVVVVSVLELVKELVFYIVGGYCIVVM